MPISWEEFAKRTPMTDDQVLAAAAILAAACMMAKENREAECAGLMRQFDATCGQAIARVAKRFQADSN
jgi:hypothetical protein